MKTSVGVNMVTSIIRAGKTWKPAGSGKNAPLMTSITWLLLLVLPGGTLGLGLLWWRRQMKRS